MKYLNVQRICRCLRCENTFLTLASEVTALLVGFPGHRLSSNDALSTFQQCTLVVSSRLCFCNLSVASFLMSVVELDNSGIPESNFSDLGTDDND